MDEFIIATAPAGMPFECAAVGTGSNEAGQFVAAWADRQAGKILAQRFSRSGATIGPLLTVRAAEPNAELIRPIVGPRGGGFVVCWIEQALNPPGPRPQVRAQVFNLEGQAIGGPTQVSTMDVDPSHPPALAFMADGGFLVAWLTPGTTDRIRAARFSPDGLPAAPEFTVNVTPGAHEGPMATHLANFNYVVAWTLDPFAVGGGSLRLRIFDFEGVPQTDELRPNLFGGEAAIDLLPDGGFVIARISLGGQDDIGVRKSIVEANLLTADGGTAVEFSASEGRNINCAWPALAAFQSGRSVVAWIQKRSDTFETTPVVHATVMSAQGHLGGVVQVSGAADARRSRTAVAGLAGSETGEHVLIVWAEDGAEGASLRGRILAVSGTDGLG